MKKGDSTLSFLLIALGLFFVAAAGYVLFTIFQKNLPSAGEVGVAQPPIAEQRLLKVAGRSILVEVARSPEEVRRGLSFRTSLPPDTGMYFVSPTPEPQRFWMYGMRFPLDIIFIRDGIIVSIAENVPAPKADSLEVPATVNSNGQADAVLEINAGKAAEWGIKEGMEVSLGPPR